MVCCSVSRVEQIRGRDYLQPEGMFDAWPLATVHFSRVSSLSFASSRLQMDLREDTVYL